MEPNDNQDNPEENNPFSAWEATSRRIARESRALGEERQELESRLRVLRQDFQTRCEERRYEDAGRLTIDMRGITERLREIEHTPAPRSSYFLEEGFLSTTAGRRIGIFSTTNTPSGANNTSGEAFVENSPASTRDSWTTARGVSPPPHLHFLLRHLSMSAPGQQHRTPQSPITLLLHFPNIVGLILLPSTMPHATADFASTWLCLLTRPPMT